MSHWVRIILEDAVSSQQHLPDSVWSGLKRVIQIVETSDVFHFRTSELEDIADAVSVCDCLSELSRLLWRAATSCGLQSFSLLVLNQGRGPVLASRMLTSFNEEWVACYERNSYQFIDPVISMARMRDGSFLFSEAESYAPTVEAFWTDAANHGMGRHGLCYAMARSNGTRIAVAFSSRHSEEKTNALIRLNRHDLEIIAQLAIECFCDVASGTLPEENLLSTRELQFLHLLARSDNPESAFAQIAAFGGNAQLQSSICQKLKVKTIYQALAIASSMQWFDSLPYGSDEVITLVKRRDGKDRVSFGIEPVSGC